MLYSICLLEVLEFLCYELTSDVRDENFWISKSCKYICKYSNYTLTCNTLEGNSLRPFASLINDSHDVDLSRKWTNQVKGTLLPE